MSPVSKTARRERSSCHFA